LGDVGINRRVILERFFNKLDVRVWTEFIWLRIGSSGQSL